MSQIERLNNANKQLIKDHNKLCEGLSKQMELIEALKKLVSSPEKGELNNNLIHTYTIGE